MKNATWVKILAVVLICVLVPIIFVVRQKSSTNNADNISNSHDAFEPFVSTDGGFTISFPNPPERVIQSVTLAGVVKTIGVLHSSVSSGGDLYSAGFTDFPPSTDIYKNVNEFLYTFANEKITNINGVMESSEYSSFLGNPAIDYTGNGIYDNQKLFMRSKAFVRGQRVFMLITLGPKADFDKFVNSFKFNQ